MSYQYYDWAAILCGDHAFLIGSYKKSAKSACIREGKCINFTRVGLARVTHETRENGKLVSNLHCMHTRQLNLFTLAPLEKDIDNLTFKVTCMKGWKRRSGCSLAVSSTGLMVCAGAPEGFFFFLYILPDPLSSIIGRRLRRWDHDLKSHPTDWWIQWPNSDPWVQWEGLSYPKFG